MLETGQRAQREAVHVVLRGVGDALHDVARGVLVVWHDL